MWSKCDQNVMKIWSNGIQMWSKCDQKVIMHCQNVMIWSCIGCNKNLDHLKLSLRDLKLNLDLFKSQFNFKAQSRFNRSNHCGSTHCNTLQHTAPHCNTLQHTAAHCNTLQQMQHTSNQCGTTLNWSHQSVYAKKEIERRLNLDSMWICASHGSRVHLCVHFWVMRRVWM